MPAWMTSLLRELVAVPMAVSRWNHAAGGAAALGTLLALLLSSVPLVNAVGAALLVGLIPLPTQAMLRRMGFDARLERAADVLSLTLAIPLAGALPAALLVAAWSKEGR